MILKEKKQQLKLMAANIKHNRFWYKHGQRTGDYTQMTVKSWQVDSLSAQFRWEHLIYCMARGRTYNSVSLKYTIAMYWILHSFKNQ